MLAGVLVDVSGSMSDALQLDVKLEDQPVTRAQSIFSTIINIVENEGGFVENEEMFALAFGLQVQGIDTCDLLALLDDVRRLDKEYKTTGHTRLTELMKNNGAPYAGKFIEKYLSQQVAGNLFETFSQNRTLLRDTIDKLPKICKNGAAYYAYSSGKSASATIRNIFSRPAQNVALVSTPQDGNIDYEETLAKKYIEEAIESSAPIKLNTMLKPKKWLLNDVVTLLREVSNSSSNSPLSEQKRLTASELSNLVNAIKPFIYGDTPMCKALGFALETLRSNNHATKVLFVLSDGEAKDGNPVTLATQLHSDVTVFTCLLTSKNIDEPRRLYDDRDPKSNWSKAQRDMFAMSSVVSNQSPAMAILLKKNWKLPPSGECRLFLHANHPEVVEEFSSLVREIGRNSDALLDMLGCVDLDLYINNKISTSEAQDQGKENTCYAFAVATVFHLAMSRIGGRDGGVPNFSTIWEELIEAFDKKPTLTEDVLNEKAKKYRLQYKKVNETQARQAINARHALVATFGLTKRQWDAFKAYYRDNPKGILQADDLQEASPGAQKNRHAVVFMRCDAESLTLMNSWGTEFANGGFFKVKDQSVLNLTFYDVFWEPDSLSETEKAAYRSRCRNLAQELAEKLPPSIRTFQYECPQCHRLSPANEFTGYLLEATCPKCHAKFIPTALGLMRYLYNGQ